MSLQLLSVHKQFGEKQVLRGIDLFIEEGTFLALLGPSGCGKTTLLQSIAGLTSIDQGQILIDNVVVSEPGREIPIEKRHIGMVFQDFALWPHMNVFEIVSFGLKLRGMRGHELKKRVVDTLAIFHMEEYLTRYPHELSGGQKQRIAMARAIAPEPRLILMDEPLSALDAGLRDEMRVELVRIFKQLNMTVIYVTHDQAEAMSMADEILLLKQGKCEQVGAPETLYKEPVSEYVAKFMGPANILRKQGEPVPRFIRPDDIQLFSQDSQAVMGTIQIRSYLGHRYRYFVKVPEYDDLIEVTHPEKIKVGEHVRIFIPAEKCRELQSV
ncbi:ABC transporter ATP-binding protein [Aneurinibacillus terranovensis]|uniref:ABC transporter ATP-binding protein n=1 Tax=Aneurinibacillus terranovensis TaxID=278991 RepID=UPI0003FCBE29|nr:ABC transporter ATP-binding protein [Aneurinibacillus terranovensis]